MDRKPLWARWLRPRAPASIIKTAAFRPHVEQLEDRLAPAITPANFTDTPIGTALSGATAMEIAPNGDIWVLEQGGRALRYRSGTTTPDVVGSLSGLGMSTNSEQGLLGIAFDPNYASNQQVFFYYSSNDLNPVVNRISRFVVNTSDPTDYYLTGTDTAPTDAGSSGIPTETVIFTLDSHSAGNHNGGAIHFGADGLLYAAVGDNANGANSQVVTNLHGKMLRLNVTNFNPSDPLNSIIPTGANANPTSFRIWNGSSFQTVTPAAGRNQLIYATGLRNPFTFAFRQGTNEFYINDVGQNAWEEIDVGGAGRNYGWSTTEGNFNTTTYPEFTLPFFTYNHSSSVTTPAGNVITGGAFYNPTINMFPADYAGDYFFADVERGWIFRIDTVSKQVNEFATGVGAVDLRVANDGSLIYVSRWDDQLHRVTYNASTAPTISTHPANQSVNVSGNATFSVVATGNPAPTYQWQRADSATPNTWNDISGATGTSYTLSNAQAADAGDRFRVVVSNSAGTVTSNVATLTVNQAPVISSQPANTTVNPGQTASFSVTATGTAPLAYQWQRFAGGTTWNNVGTNSSSYSFTTVAGDNGAQFRVVMSNVAGSVTSNTATLTVTQAPVISSQPANTTVNPASTASFSVTATGTAPLAYQWQRFAGGTTWNNVGTNASSYSFTTVAGDNGAQFRVVITNAAGSTTSNTATLTVRQPVAITTQPGNQSVNEGTAAAFSVSASGTAPLAYQWQRFAGGTTWNNVGTNSNSYSFTTVAADNGAQFRVIVSNAVNSVTSSTATLTVNRRPTAAITVTGGLSPGGNFIAGQAITFTGSGTDPDGTTPTLSYQVDYVTSLSSGGIVRPFVPLTSGANGSFTPATTGPYNLTDVLHRIYVTATDAGGLSHTATLDIDPETYSFTIQTTPAGLQLTVDSIPASTPATIQSIVGFERPLSAVANGGYTFQQWSDGVTSPSRVVTGLSGPTSFTAIYLPITGVYQQGPSPDFLVVMEAEGFHSSTSQGGKNWAPDTTAGYTGASAMITTPNTGVINNTGYAANSPRLDYQVNFTQTGTHYVWIRGLGPNGGDDSVHLGIDGVENTTADRIQLPTSYGWTSSTMDGVRATINVATPGLHTINLWMREDGAIIDRILLTTSAGFTPSGTGPAESGRVVGTGLTGSYYDNINFTSPPRSRYVYRRVLDDSRPAVTRVEEVNFDWGTATPAPGIAPDTFSVRWLGKIQPRYSETYTFYTTSDDGVRLRINGQLLIDQWNDHSATVHSGTITLQAGQLYDIQLEYYENGGSAVMKLEWQSASQAREIVPLSQLFPS